MATLSWTDVVLIGAVGCIGFTLLSYWFSGVMSRRNWSWQVKPKAKDHKPAPPAPPSPPGK